MNSKNILAVLATLTIFSISACSSVDGQGRYRVQSIGNAQRSIEATVISATPVYIQEITSGGGAALGATTGGGLAADGSDNVAVIIAGVIAGAIIGDYVEGLNNLHDATEYVIETSSQSLFTVAQVDKGSIIFKEGDKVILVYGYPTRLLPDPR